MKSNENHNPKEQFSFRNIDFIDIYNILFKNARDGIVLIDFETGIIIDANPEFQRQTGRTLEE